MTERFETAKATLAAIADAGPDKAAPGTVQAACLWARGRIGFLEERLRATLVAVERTSFGVLRSCEDCGASGWDEGFEHDDECVLADVPVRSIEEWSK